MYIKQAQKLYGELQKSLLERKFLKRIDMTKKAMTDLLSKGHYKQALPELLDQKPFVCQDIFYYCAKDNPYFKHTPKEGWLPLACRYLINLLFPEKAWDSKDDHYIPSLIFYFQVLQVFFDYERETLPFDPLLHFDFLAPEELEETEFAKEYQIFTRIFREKYVYSLMRINREVTQYNTLAHIAGVHHMAMYIGKQLKAANVPTDLALISGASAGHDLGKYGCKPEEESRVPYLHYYYTNQWFSQNGMLGIGHIASNHSTWDLELENLSVESLVLIYADFRVKSKQKQHPQDKEAVTFYSLADSFDVILNKLDNLDEAKQHRYRAVYAKLKDFEEYMLSFGVNTELDEKPFVHKRWLNSVLLTSEQAVDRLKYLAIEHNITVMNKFSTEISYASIIEAARSEKDWKNIRAYIDIIEEYFTYMTQRQKLLTLSFLYELLMHREGDIRRQAAALIGDIIVHYDEEYRKEVPSSVVTVHKSVDSLGLWRKYLDSIVYPDHKISPQHKSWIGFTLKIIVDVVLSHDNPKLGRKYLNEYLNYCDDADIDDSTAFVLLDSLTNLDLSLCNEFDLLKIASFTKLLVKRKAPLIKTAALGLAVHLSSSQEYISMLFPVLVEIMDSVDLHSNSYKFLKYQISKNLGYDEALLKAAEDRLFWDGNIPSELFLENLKVATPWINKVINIDFLLEHLKYNPNSHIMQIVSHFSNLIKVSERIVVRHRAGDALISLADKLTLEQCNEIVIELTQGLEIGEYEVSKYIPEYLGRLALFLEPQELDEFIGSLGNLLNNANERSGALALNTMGVVIQYYPEYQKRFLEPEAVFRERRRKLLGMILSGLANYHELISQEAFLVIGKHIFGSKILTVEDKKDIFTIICKKLLTLINEQEETELSFFNNAASLNHLYRFISDYMFNRGRFGLLDASKMAYFPGTFDPFSLSHKGIVREIRNMGFEVYLALDEFSWSKKTQPRMIRRQIANMSVADEFDVFIFPDNFPVNIANPKDLRRLRELFYDETVYIVVGNDVIENASSYRSLPVKDSIHHFNHIVFNRRTYEMPEGASRVDENPREYIQGEIIDLSLPVHLEDISSTRIRENIDFNRDISTLINPVAQNYIYHNSLYLRENQYKEVLETDDDYFEYHREISPKIKGKLLDLLADSELDRAATGADFETKGEQLITIKKSKESEDIQAFIAFHHISASALYEEFKDVEIAEYVRKNTSGKIIVISAIYGNPKIKGKNLTQWVVTEALAHCLKNDFTYALYYSAWMHRDSHAVDVLHKQGFLQIPCGKTPRPVYAVDMKSPIVLINNIQTAVKAPFNSNLRVLEVMDKTHCRLQQSLTYLYPGTLVLDINTNVMNYGIISKITQINKVPAHSTPLRKLGKYMCVPFGKILRDVVVPNTVTKTLHTEKVFDPDLSDFQISHFPYYSSLENQIKTIKSFDRDVILVDDIVHKGYRLREIVPIFKKEKIKIKKIVVGVMSSRGKDLLDIQERPVESVYFIPNLRIWFVESSLYPFMGGDAVHQEAGSGGSSIPSVNMILPYMAPRFINQSSQKAIYDFSMTCLENARDILEVLEVEYQNLFERKLTLNRMRDAILTSRYPDKGQCVTYDKNLAPSSYVKNDIGNLIRLSAFIRD